MYRTSRDTSSWFDSDNKGTLFDRSIAKSLGPGKYQMSVTTANTSHMRSTDSSQSFALTTLTSKKSWNTGSVPFGSGTGRLERGGSTRFATIQGPGSYE